MSDLFKKTRFYQTGYAPAGVDAFFAKAKAAYESQSDEVGAADVRSVAFGLARGGYDPLAVDKALDRLETAFATRERDQAIETGGRSAWVEALGDKARTLYPRLGRPRGERFAAAAAGHLAYDTDEVDELLDRITAYFDDGAELDVEQIRSATFSRRSGNNGYAEGPVDAFLDRVVEVLLGVS